MSDEPTSTKPQSLAAVPEATPSERSLIITELKGKLNCLEQQIEAIKGNLAIFEKMTDAGYDIFRQSIPYQAGTKPAKSDIGPLAQKAKDWLKKNVKPATASEIYKALKMERKDFKLIADAMKDMQDIKYFSMQGQGSTYQYIGEK